MKIGLIRIHFHIAEAQSLKQKRQVMRSIKDRLVESFDGSEQRAYESVAQAAAAQQQDSAAPRPHAATRRLYI